MTIDLERRAAVLILGAAVACAQLCGANHPSGRFYLHFSGDGQYVEIPSAPDLSPGSGGFTVSAWLEADALEFSAVEGSGYVYWMGKGERGDQEWALRMYGYTNRENPPRPNRISFYLFNPEGGLGEGSYFQRPVHPREWIHITATAGAGNTAIYRNGEYMHCDEYNGPAGRGCQAHNERIRPVGGSAPLRIGTRGLKSFFAGGIAEVRIWNRALSAEEVRQLYRGSDVPREGLTADFPLDEGKGDAVHDRTGGHLGKIVGAQWRKMVSE